MVAAWDMVGRGKRGVTNAWGVFPFQGRMLEGRMWEKCI
jgi:hypothetical protein